MQRIWLSAAAIAFLCGSAAFSDPAQGVPRIDKQKLEVYIRYAEGYMPEVQMSIDDPAPSPFKGYYHVLVHLSAGSHRQDRLYYVTEDLKHVINGNLWDLNDNPFRDTLEHVPTSGPSFGPANAKVTIVVFSDFECPYCRNMAQTLRQNIPQKYPNDVRVVFENFPLDAMHKWARAAAEAGQCIAEEKPAAFWAFHDWMFEHQQEVNEGNLREKVAAIAKDQGMDVAALESCMDKHATAQRVKESEQAGEMLQISQTPTLFINGRMASGAYSWDALNTIIQMELHRPKEIPGPGEPACCQVNIPTATKK